MAKTLCAIAAILLANVCSAAQLEVVASNGRKNQWHNQWAPLGHTNVLFVLFSLDVQASQNAGVDFHNTLT